MTRDLYWTKRELFRRSDFVCVNCLVYYRISTESVPNLSYSKHDPSLDGERCARRVSTGRTADSWVGLVLSGVPRHLSNGATGAKEGAAHILAADTVLLRNGILPADALTSATKAV